MKVKKISKKLVLSKKTIANLENSELNVIQGGRTASPRGTCHTWCDVDPYLSICACEYTGYTACDTYCPCP